MSKEKHYLTGLEALNYHGADWHSFAYDFNRNYPPEVRKWCGNYGVVEEENREIANPVRAFLDYLFYNIKYRKRVPTKRIEDLLFSEKEEKEIKRMIENNLKKYLKGKDKEILELWIKYNNGGDYEFTNIRLLKRKAWRERRKKTKFNLKSFEEGLRQAFNL